MPPKIQQSILKIPTWNLKQLQVWDSLANELLLAGDTRGGKSFFIRKAYILWCTEIPGLICDIFRVNYDDVIRNHMEGETSFPALLDQWERDGLVKINKTEIVFWNDSRIHLEHCADDDVMRKHQGVPRHVRTLEESGQMLERRIRALSGWVTMSDEMKSRVPEKWKGLFPKMFHVTNFLGPGMGFYRRGFLEQLEPFQIKKVGQFNRQYIPFYLDDNPHEDAEATRARIKEAFTDPATQQALLECNWRAAVGDFFTEWSFERHVVRDFYPPGHWLRFRTFDWGTADPAVCYWIAVSDGEAFKDGEGNERWFPRGALIFYNEWYICKSEKEPGVGARMRNEDMAAGIVSRSEHGFTNVPTLTDSFPFQDKGGETIADTFRKEGVVLTLGDTSRVPGWSHMRSRLIGIEIDSNWVDETGKVVRVPMIYFTQRCKYASDYIPALPRHKSETKSQDAAEHGEATHACDAIRLACMAHSVIKDRKEPIESRIKKEIAASRKRNTMKSIAAGSGIKW